jgi:hypothetical protein
VFRMLPRSWSKAVLAVPADRVAALGALRPELVPGVIMLGLVLGADGRDENAYCWGCRSGSLCWSGMGSRKERGSTFCMCCEHQTHEAAGLASVFQTVFACISHSQYTQHYAGLGASRTAARCWRG